MDILLYAKPQETQLCSVPYIEIREEGDNKNGKKKKLFCLKIYWLIYYLSIYYAEKLEDMVKEGIDKGRYTLTEDNTIKDLFSI